jgi:hypothetical protein
MLIGLSWTIQHYTQVADSLFTFLAAQGQTFFTVKAFNALMINLMAFTA